MTKPTLSEKFTDFAIGLRFNAIPKAVIDVARINFLDSLGVMSASWGINAGGVGRTIAKRLAGAKEASVIGLAEKVPAPSAVIANGLLIHSLDLDDSHSPSITHPSGVVVTTAIAMGEAVGASGEEVITAAVAGYELVTRMGSAAPGEFIKNGLHTTGITGPFATALVAARLLGLNREQTISALGLAGSQVSGLMEFLADGSDAKQFYAGWASHSGVMAALLAREGLTGPRSVLDGRQGFFNTYLPSMKDKFDFSVFDDLGTRWRTTDIVYKAYPACHLTHCIIDSIKHLQHAHGFKADDIASAECRVPEWYVDKICEPLVHKRAPRTAYEARFSIPYVAATTLVQGDVPIEQFTPAAIKNEAILNMAKRVSYKIEEFPEFPKVYPGGIAIKLKDGREIEQYQRFTRKLSHDDLREKYAKNVRKVLSPASAKDVERRVMQLGAAPDSLEPIMKNFRADTGLARETIAAAK